MKAINIKWDVDDTEDLKFLPTSIIIPENLEDLRTDDGEICDDVVSDYITDQTGFCHCGYTLVEE